MEKDPRGLGIATGIIAIIFGLAVGVAVGYFGCYYWVWHTKWSMWEKGILMGVLSLLGLVGVLYDTLIAINGFDGGTVFTDSDGKGMTRTAIVVGIIFGGVVPGIMLAVHSKAEINYMDAYEKSRKSSYDTSYGSGSSIKRNDYGSKPKTVVGSTKKPKVVGSTKRPRGSTTSGSTKRPKFSNPGRPGK